MPSLELENRKRSPIRSAALQIQVRTQQNEILLATVVFPLTQLAQENYQELTNLPL